MTTRAVRSALLVALLSAVIAEAAVPTAPHGPVFLGAVGGKSGWSVASLGDINGDGWGDLAVGDPNTGNGRVEIFLGGAAGVTSRPAIVIEGPNIGEQFGFSVASIGDVDGDGWPDFAVGAPLAPGLAAAAVRAGRVSLFTTTAMPALNATWSPALVVAGDASDDRLGSAVAGGGDATRDGVGDLLISAPQSAGTAGRVGLLSGTLRGTGTLTNLASAIIVGAHSGDELGEVGLAMRGARWLVGAPDAGAGGMAYLLEGSPSGSVTDVALRTWSGDPGSGFGFDVVFGAPDRVLISAPLASGADGAVFVMNETTGARVTTIRGFAGGTAGSSLAWGDLDGDGEGDLIVGAPLAQTDSTSPGSVAILFGPLAPGVVDLAAAPKIFGSVNDGRFAFAADLVASPDAQHAKGILVGAPRQTPQAHLLLDLPPIARTHDVRQPCTGPLTNVSLDASGSTDADGPADITGFAWSDAAGSVVGRAANVTVALPLGEAAFHVRVSDIFGFHGIATARVQVVDDVPPVVRFQRLSPRHVYVEDRDALTLPVPLIGFATQVGNGTYRVSAHDACSGIAKVEFYADDALVWTDDAPPYEWTRDPHAILPAFDRVRAIAYDGAGNTAEACIPALDTGWVSIHHLPIVAGGPPPLDEWTPHSADVIGGGTPCAGEWSLPFIGDAIPVNPPLGI